ncbi:MAG: recombinase family protein [Pseudomonadota bacterium]
MRYGYTASIKGAPSEADQRETLIAAGVPADRIVSEGVPVSKPKPKQDRRPWRTTAIEFLRDGDQLCVVSPRIIARNAGDLFRVAATITQAGGGLFVVDLDREFTATEDHARLAEAFTGDANQAQIQRARQSKRKNSGGRPQVKGLPKGLKKTDPKRLKFERMWNSEADSQDDMALVFGCSKATIIRRAAEWGLGAKK